MRLKDWPSRLDAALAAARRRPFEWGAHDCCLFAASVVEACTGVDLAAELRGTYSDALAAAALVESLGGIDAIAALAGLEIDPELAAAGDIGLAEIEGRQSLVVNGGQVWLGAGAGGLLVAPASSVTRAWRIGEP
jgi:hypothetical protein